MVDPVAVVVKYLSTKCPTLAIKLEDMSPSGFVLQDHIQGGNDLPVGWNVADHGPVVMVSLQGGTFYNEDAPLINARITAQCYAALDSEASDVAYALLDAMHEKSGPRITYARADGPPQTIADRTTEWRIGVVYFSVRVRNIQET